MFNYLFINHAGNYAFTLLASAHEEKSRQLKEVAMRKEIYITLLLFALMLFALASTVVNGQTTPTLSYSSNSVQETSPGYLALVPVEDEVVFEAQAPALIFRYKALPTRFQKRGLQVVIWSSRSTIELLHSLAERG